MIYLLYIYILFIPLQTLVDKIPSFGYGINWINITTLILFVFSLKSNILSQSTKVYVKEVRRFYVLLMIFILYTFVSYVFGRYNLKIPEKDIFSDDFIAWKDFVFALILTYIISVYADNESKVKNILIVILLSGIYSSLLFVNNAYYWNLYHYSDKLRFMVGTFGNKSGSNEQATYFAYISIMAISMLLIKIYNKYKLILLCAIPIYIAALAYSYSRGSYFAFIVALVLFLITKYKLKSLIYIILITGLFYVTVIRLVPLSVMERVTMTINEEGELDDSGRFELWKWTVENIPDNPIIGSGYRTFRYLSPEGADTHNFYLKLFFETGFFGLFIWITMIIYSFRIGFRLLKETTNVTGQLVGSAICSVVILSFVANLFGDRSSYYCLAGVYWSILGLGIACNKFMYSQDNLVER